MIKKTDLALARRFVNAFGTELRYIHDSRSWMVWDGHRWRFDRSGATMRRAKQIPEAVAALAATAPDAEQQDSVIAYAHKLESRARLNAMISLATTEAEVSILSDEMDTDPWAFNVLNGTIDLRDGSLREHDREDLISKLAPVEYHPDAECPQFLEFVRWAMGNDDDMVRYLQRIIGYCLTGDTGEQALFIFYGTGANGKSVFMETIRSVLGDYAQQSDFTTFTQGRRGVRDDIARMAGTRLVSAVESERTHALSESLIKQLTGGDMVASRPLRGQYIEFRPQLKIILTSNHLPIVRGADHGIWRRLRVLPWQSVVADKDRDPHLAITLRRELPGILNWALEGCLGWLDEGTLGNPPPARDATDIYKQEMDVLQQFLSQACIISPQRKEAAAALYAAYVQWCEFNKEEPISQKMFGMSLRERGFRAVRDGRARYWTGLAIRPEEA